MAGAPAFSGAPAYAQSDTTSLDITSLIHTVVTTDRTEKTAADRAADSLRRENAKGNASRIYLPRTAEPRYRNTRGMLNRSGDATSSHGRRRAVITKKVSEEEVTDNVLDRIIFEANKEAEAAGQQTAQSSVLDFMTKVYAEHGFYQTGHWDDAEDWSAITRNIRLPEYDPDDFYRPVWGRITSTYGFRPSFGRLHKGIDLALNMGDTVRAALPGVVAKVSYDPGGYGHYIVLVHNNGMETRYAHLQGPLSTLGQSVSAGDPIGLGGNSGNSTGPHLHFEVRYRGTALDPASLFNFHALPRRRQE